MKEKNVGNSEKIYINEIIRINYRCNWACKFCNILKTNNYGKQDIGSKEVINKIFALTKKYSSKQRKNLILSFSGGEPTLNKNLVNYIKLAKELGVGIVEIQTNGTILFKNKKLINEYINVGLDEIFLAQHSNLKEINDNLGIYYNINDFINWVNYIKENNIDQKVNIYLNIVVGKINLPYLLDFIKYLIKIGFINFIGKTRWVYESGIEKELHKISFGLTQPNGYAEINANEVLLKFDEDEMKLLNEVIKYCENNNIFLDFHFTSPPLCVLNYPNYNLEHSRLKKLEENKKKGEVNEGNLEAYKYLWKEKIKFYECKNCKYNNYCLGFYKNWIKFVGEKYANDIVKNFLNN